jgi:O-antigen ligase
MFRVLGILGDVFSLEFLFVAFLFGGAYKNNPYLRPLNSAADLTLVTALAGIGCATFLLIWQPPLFHRKIRLYVGLYLGLLAWALLSYALNPTGDYATQKIQKFGVLCTWALVCPLFFMTTDERLDRFFRLITAVALFSAVTALAAGVKETSAKNLGMFGIEENYQQLGNACGMGLIVLLSGLAFATKYYHKLVIAVGVALLGLTMFLSGARQSAVGAILAAIFIVFAVSTNRILVHKVKGLFLALVCVAAFSISLKMLVFPDLEMLKAEDRITALFSVGQEKGWDPSKENRPKLLQAALEQWEQSPITGGGFGSYAEFSMTNYASEVKWPHNFFLELLCELGIVGFVMGFFLFWMPFWTWLQNRDLFADRFGASIMALLVFESVGALVSRDLVDNRGMFVFAGMAIAYYARKDLYRPEVILLPAQETVGEPECGEATGLMLDEMR